MKRWICKILLMVLVMTGCAVTWETTAVALEPKLLWKKEFEYKIHRVDLAKETGDVILSGDGNIFLYNKEGDEQFRIEPTTDIGYGSPKISSGGKYFLFTSNPSAKYLEDNKLAWWDGGRVHFYNGQTNKELWNGAAVEGYPLLFPDGSGIIMHYHSGSSFDIRDSEGNKIFEYEHQFWDLPDFALSPDGNYFAVVRHITDQPLILFKDDGTKLWEKGVHGFIASISEGASYISTEPYILLKSDNVVAPENYHKGTVYDRDGNIVLKGFGILSGDGSRIAMLSPFRVTVMSLPDKTFLKEIAIQVYGLNNSKQFFATFSHDGRYLVLRSETAIVVSDLDLDVSKEIVVKRLGNSPNILLTKDGKYLLVRPSDNKKIIYYYQLY